MSNLAVRLASLAACLLLSGCALGNERCGTEGLHCESDEAVCVCATGKCAEPDDDCASGIHYVGGRCVPRHEAATAVPSSTDYSVACPVADGGGDDARDDGRDGDAGAFDIADAWDLGGAI
jgi:hypothetical protein